MVVQIVIKIMIEQRQKISDFCTHMVDFHRPGRIQVPQSGVSVCNYVTHIGKTCSARILQWINNLKK